MFDWLSGNEKGFITKDDVRNLSRDEMRALVLNFEGTDVSNTEEAEYGVIDVSQVRYIPYPDQWSLSADVYCFAEWLRILCNDLNDHHINF